MSATIEQLYSHFDLLAEQDDACPDELFASSYIRGFIALATAEFGDESQQISSALVDSVTTKLADAKAELTPDDRQLVNQYWQSLITQFTT